MIIALVLPFTMLLILFTQLCLMFNQKPSCCQESNKQGKNLQISLVFGLILTTKVCMFHGLYDKFIQAFIP